MERRETNLIEHTKYIYEYQNAVDENTVESIREILSSNLYGTSPHPGLEKTEVRNNIGFNINYYKNKNKQLDNVISCIEYLEIEYFKKYFTDCQLMRNYYQPYGSLGKTGVYRVYDKNDYYEWHCDTDKMFRFVASFILYLNDDFEGGNTLFLNDKLKVSPKKGSILMFPCGPYFVHKSTPIKSGKKEIIWNCYVDAPKEFAAALESYNK
jgi:hypothetical protein